VVAVVVAAAAAAVATAGSVQRVDNVI
jgi:hypothetical protein